jgi:hypothetical protein
MDCRVKPGNDKIKTHASGKFPIRAYALRNVFGLFFASFQARSTQVQLSPEHERTRRQRLFVQCRHDPSRSHCTRRAKAKKGESGV